MYIGVDIGGTKTLVASADVDNKVVSQQKISTPAKAEVGIEAIVDLIHAVAGQSDINAIGVAIPGPINWDKSELGASPNLHWKGAKIVKRLEEHFRVPIVLENDANSAALGEARLGAGKDHEHVLYVGIGTGIGTGVVINGKVYRGAHDTEGGHIVVKPGGDKCGCGGHGHWETIASGSAIVRRFGREAREITEQHVWDQYSADLALGLVNLTAALSPEIIVIGGGVSVYFDKFAKPLQKHFDEMYQIYDSPSIVPAKFRETAAVYGAILLARQAAR